MLFGLEFKGVKMTNENDDVGYNSWDEVPTECPACESGIDCGDLHYITIQDEQYVHPRCCLHGDNTMCYGCMMNSLRDEDHCDANGEYHPNCYCMNRR